MWATGVGIFALVVMGGGYVFAQQSAESARLVEVDRLKQKRLAALQAVEGEGDSLVQGSGEPRLVCWFGSQTGTAEGFSKSITELGKKYGFKASRSVDLDEFDSFESSLVNDGKTVHVFVLATYGEGEPSDNAAKFSQKLKRYLDHAPGATFQFTVFGLGNTQYEHYNQFARWVNASLEAVGGQRVFRYGEGDDDGTLQDDFALWLEDLHPELAHQHGLAELEPTLVVEKPAFTQDFQWIGNQELPHGGRFVSSQRKQPPSNAQVDFSSKPYFRTEAFPVKRITELKSAGCVSETNSTLHIELQLPDSIKQYGTAHNLCIMPENAPKQVLQVAEQLKWTAQLDEWFSLRTCKCDPQVNVALFPTPCTLRTALETCVDLSALPSKSWIEKLAYFARDPVEQKQLLLLSSRAGKRQYHAMVLEPKLCLYEFLAHFPSIAFDHPGQFLELAPRLSPRDYTIASSNKAHPSEIHLIVSMVSQPRSTDNAYFGVCTSSLNRRREQQPTPVYAFLKPSAFLLPAQTRTPILLIGPGTGVAPMRALLQERQWQKQQSMRVGESALFFGCRHPEQDFYYKAEWEQLRQEGVLTKQFTAFSRELAHKRVYVQDLLVEQGEWVWDWISELGAYVYVCGSTGMGKDVGLALHQIAKKHGKLTELQTKEFFLQLSAQKRYVQELWS